jgi:hypothetical protein
MLRTGLPDGLFSDQKSLIWFFVGLEMENLGIFMAISVLLSPLGVFYLNLVYFVIIWYIFPPFWYIVSKNLATLVEKHKLKKEMKDDDEVFLLPFFRRNLASM